MKTLRLLFACGLGLLSICSYGQPGQIDRSYGSTTKAGSFILPNTMGIPGSAHLLHQDDGKLIAVYPELPGQGFTIVRFLSNLEPDPSFGQNGRVSLSGYRGLICTHLTPTGNLLILTEINESSPVLIQFNAQGQPDESFGDGTVQPLFGVADARDLIVLPDGSILVLSYQKTALYEGRYVITKYNRDGTTDGSFGDNGRYNSVRKDSDASDSNGGLAADLTGHILLSSTDDETNQHVLTRLNPYGLTDTSFGDQGYWLFDPGETYAGRKTDILVSAQNEYLFWIAYTQTLIKIDQSGHTDPTFATNGHLTAAETLSQFRNDPLLTRDGKIRISGSKTQNDQLQYITHAYTSEGKPDASFGENGRFETCLPAHSESFASVRTSEDAAGRIWISSHHLQHFVLILNSRGTFDTALAPSVAGYLFLQEGTLDPTAGLHTGWQSNGRVVLAAFDPIEQQFFVSRFQADLAGFDEEYGTNGKSYSGMPDDPGGGARLMRWGTGRGERMLFSAYDQETKQYYLRQLGLGGTNEGSVFSGYPDDPAGQVDLGVQSDGKILLAAFDQDQNSFYVARYTSSGQPDLSFNPEFGGGGRALTGQPDIASCGISLLVLPDDRILLCARRANPDRHLYLTRLFAQGDTDKTFGTQGIVMPGITGTSGPFTCIRIQPDGKILIWGFDAESDACKLIRLLADGSPDEDFGKSGVAEVLGIRAKPDGAADMVILDNGQILVSATEADQEKLYRIRYEADGKIDRSFGDDGNGMSDFTVISQAGTRLVESDDFIMQMCYKGPTDYGLCWSRYYLNRATDRMEYALSDSFQVYPNPFSQELHIAFASGIRDVEITMIDQHGTIVKQKKQSGPGTISLNRHLAPGVYYLRIGAPGQSSIVRRMVKYD